MTDFLFGAKDLIAHLGKTGFDLPKNALMCHSRSIAAQICKGQPWRAESALGAKWTFVSEHLVLVSGFGLGAPAAAAKFEEMRCLGVERVVFIGTAGALQSDVRIGETVLVERARSAEGTSKHYSSKDEFSSDAALTEEVAKVLRGKLLEYRRGSTWSTDAPYRESRSTLTKLENQGVTCVDMEASALYAVAEKIGIKAAGVFLVSDGLSGGHWQPAFSDPILRKQFVTVAQALVQAISRWKT